MKPTPRPPKERPGTPRSRGEVKVGDGKFIHMRPLAEGLGLSPGGGVRLQGFRVFAWMVVDCRPRHRDLDDAAGVGLWQYRVAAIARGGGGGEIADKVAVLMRRCCGC